MKNIRILLTLASGFVILSGTIAQTKPMNNDKNNRKTPDYSTLERKEIPVEYTWKIDDIYPTLEAWKADKEKVTQMLGQVDGLEKDWTSSSANMLSLLKMNEEMGKMAIKLYSYASHQSNVDLANNQYKAMTGDLQSLFVEYGAKLAFFNPDVIALGDEKFHRYLKQEPGLEPYRFSIENILRGKAHVLPKEQQEIVSMTGLFTEVPSEASSMLNNLEIPVKEVTLSDGKKISLTPANFQHYRMAKNPADRELVMTTYYNNLKTFENTMAILMNGAMKEHFFSAKVTKFNDCLSAKLFDDNIPTTVYTSLITTIKDNLAPLHRYLRLKQRLLNLPKLRSSDLFASAVPAVDKEFSFEEAKKIVLEMAKPLGADYTGVLSTAFLNRWIDIYPNKGKESGAYSSGVYGVHPFVKMNFTGKYEDVSTLAHELGHSMHSYYANASQPYVNSSYSTFIAEIASTFNENLLMEYFLKNETDDMFKLFILDNYLETLRGTLYHQTMFADFELNMHQYVEKDQTLTADWLDQKFLDLNKEYYGHAKDVCEVDDYIQCGWARIPHFYMNYYVFQYSTGIVASLALADMVLKGGDDARTRYLSVLKAGGSDYPIEILKKAGLDMTSPAPYEEAIKRFDDLVMEMEKIVTRLKAANKL
ncbi:MAG: oligoendopeptidase F [Bacteroidetes bacterium]|nr:oligoendopeptidase F [Bacteroidota bacterium]